jgi:hypothetical protein
MRADRRMGNGEIVMQMGLGGMATQRESWAMSVSPLGMGFPVHLVVGTLFAVLLCIICT